MEKLKLVENMIDSPTEYRLSAGSGGPTEYTFECRLYTPESEFVRFGLPQSIPGRLILPEYFTDENFFKMVHAHCVYLAKRIEPFQFQLYYLDDEEERISLKCPEDGICAVEIGKRNGKLDVVVVPEAKCDIVDQVKFDITGANVSLRCAAFSEDTCDVTLKDCTPTTDNEPSKQELTATAASDVIQTPTPAGGSIIPPKTLTINRSDDGFVLGYSAGDGRPPRQMIQLPIGYTLHIPPGPNAVPIVSKMEARVVDGVLVFGKDQHLASPAGAVEPPICGAAEDVCGQNEKVDNLDLIQELDEMNELVRPKRCKVDAHSVDPNNDKADE